MTTEINVVIIGETGSGKSTLINYLTNLFYNGSLTNLKLAISTRYLQANMSSVMTRDHEYFQNDVTLRQTSQCTKYQYKVKDVYFNFYDTSGINATGSYSVDNENLEKLFHCIQSFDHLTALVLVINGTQARLTINIKIVLECLYKRLPNVFHKNLIIILTNCTSHTVNFDSIKLFKHLPIFYMQNSAFSSEPQTWSTKIYDILQHDWNQSITTMNEFIKSLLLLTPISTRYLTEMKNDQDRIRSILHECRLIIMELTTLEETSDIYTTNIEESDIQTKTIQVNEIISTPYHNTLCLQCNTVCHEQCSLTETTQIGEHDFRHCIVMNNGQCTQCFGQCSYNMHYHDYRLIKSVSRTLKYHKFNKEKMICDEECKTVQERKNLLERLLHDQMKKIHDTYLRLQNHCHDFSLVDELYTFIQLLKNDLMTIKSASAIHQIRKVIDEFQTFANKKSRIKKKAIAARSTNEKYAEYTTEQLIDLTRQFIEEHLLIIEELHQRC
ncbi:hypothetical protein I4U23_024792 [Adineta vaga]|nr:hypothetical protein I4U23_024792 [Adineta vaga]